MESKFKKLILATFAMVIIVISSLYFSGYFIKRLKRNPIYYCYDNTGGFVNSALVIEDLEFKDSLVKYYSQVQKGINPVFNFPLKTLPQYEPVYLLSYSKDSLVAYVVSFYNRGSSNGGSFNKYYVDIRTLHKDPAKKVR